MRRRITPFLFLALIAAASIVTAAHPHFRIIEQRIVIFRATNIGTEAICTDIPSDAESSAKTLRISEE